jgi:hypothetical protein
MQFARFSLPLYQPQVLPEPGDLQVNVTMPSARHLAGLDTLELDFSLSCPGHFDAGSCCAWARFVHGCVVLVCNKSQQST